MIAPGPSDVDRDGPAFIGDPDMGFAGLKNFGPTLIHHTMLKIRQSTAVKNFMIVDTPGMIDSPRRDNGLNSLLSQGASTEDIAQQVIQQQKQLSILERGYDFEKVCRWYAERADVILLFFDPDKPGLLCSCFLIRLIFS